MQLPDNRDHLRIGFAANTIFITGSSPAFGAQGGQLRSMTTDAGPYLKRFNGNHHYCVELGDHGIYPWYRRKRRHPTLVHIEYCPRWEAA